MAEISTNFPHLRALNRDLGPVLYSLVSCNKRWSQKVTGNEPKKCSTGSTMQCFKQRPWKQDKCSWPYQLELSPKGSGHRGQSNSESG